MFANNTFVMDFAVADTVVTPAGVPVPLINMAFSAVNVPSQFHIIIGGGLVENVATQGTTSVGDQAGAGVASGINSGPEQSITFSIKSFMGAMPTTKMTSLQIQNLTNIVGASLTPGQIRVLILT